MNRFVFEKTIIEGVYTITPKKIRDNRGYYERYFCSDEFKEVGFNNTVRQINHSQTIARGVIRGFHYQKKPYEETKLVRCIKGGIFDVALDVRKDSPTFLQYVSCELTEENSKYMLIPKGVAHAFQTLTDISEVLYLVDREYQPSIDVAINPLDPTIEIDWPVEVNKELSKEVTQGFIDKSL